jgi:hypothetical protein
MALVKLGLGSIVNVAAASTATVYTVSSSQPAYIRSIIVHNTGQSASTVFKLHFVPNDDGSVGVASVGNIISQISLVAADTYFLEFMYPIVLSNNNDTIQIFNSNASDPINVFILGDKEAL